MPNLLEPKNGGKTIIAKLTGILNKFHNKFGFENLNKEQKKQKINSLLNIKAEGGMFAVLVIEIFDVIQKKIKFIKGDKGDRGLKGEQGERGKIGKDGIRGKQGNIGPRGLTGQQGVKGDRGDIGIQGAPGSPDDPKDIKKKLEKLKGNNRVDASAIKNIPTIKTELPNLSLFGNNRGGGSSVPNMEILIDGDHLGRDIRKINFTGIATGRRNGSGGAVINIPSAAAPSIAHVDLTDMPSADNDDHDGRYRTEAELASTTPGASGSELIGIEGLETPTYRTMQTHINNTFSSGVITGFNITDSNAGQVDIAPGTGMIRATNSTIADLLQFDYAGTTNLELTNNKANWIYIDYDTGTPIAKATLTLNDLNFNTNFVIGRVYRDDDELHIVHTGNYYNNNPHIMGYRLWEVYGMQRASGLVTSETGTRNLAITAGSFYMAQKRFTTLEIDTSDTDTFSLWYRANGGGWTETPGETQISNTDYDDGGGLPHGTILPNQYGVFWLYIHDDGDIHVIMGQNSYKLSEALEASLPSSLPEKVTSTGILIARITIKRDELSSFTDVSTPWNGGVMSSAVTDHDDLAGLQGGQADEYYHLTSAQHADVPLNTTHRGLTDNPHSVTKAQVGLTNVSDDAQLKIASNLGDLDNAATARSNLGLGSAAEKDTGTGAGNVPVLDGSGKLVDNIIPDLAISEYLGNFADTTAALADAGVQSSERGDWFTIDTHD